MERKKLVEQYKWFKEGRLYSSRKEKYIESEKEFWAIIAGNIFDQSFQIDPEDTITPTLQYEICINQIKNRGHHFYVSSEDVINFIETNKIASEDIKKVIEIMKSKVPPIDVSKFTIDLNTERKEHSGSIHFLNRNYSLVFRCSSLVIDYKETNYITYSIGINEEDGWVATVTEEDGLDDSIENKNWKTLFNLFLYMDAFPEAVKEGPPPVKMPAGHIAKKCTIIGESEAIREVYRNGITPHMRRGHFRFLQADRYVNCRYKTVYVKPTMVKGRAEHVVGV